MGTPEWVPYTGCLESPYMKELSSGLHETNSDNVCGYNI